MALNILIVGVGEVGHNIVRFLPRVNSVMVADPDWVEPHNRSYQGMARTPKVSAVLSELRERGYSPRMVQNYNVSPLPNVAFGFCRAVSPTWRFPEWLVVECTDDAGMLSLPAVHVHTDITPDGLAVFSVWEGAIEGIKPRLLPHGCTDRLARAAVVAAQRFVQLLEVGRFPEFPGITEIVEEG